MEDIYQKKRLFVLGGTGGTGVAFIDRALGAGHSVTAYVRSPDKVARRERLTVLGGDVCDPEALAAAAVGHDAVVTSIGGPGRGPRTIAADSARAVLAAMVGVGLRRLVMVSAALLFEGGGLVYWIGRRILRAPMGDLAAAERALVASDREWTIVRPPELTDRPGGRAVRVSEGRRPYGFSIARADLARFLLDVVEGDRYVRQIVGVSK